jgi:hypothetical protein
LWCNDKIDNRMEVVLGYCLGEFVEKVKGKIVNIASGEVSTAWCGSLPSRGLLQRLVAVLLHFSFGF